MAYRTSTTALQLRHVPSSSVVGARPYAMTQPQNLTAEDCFGRIPAEKQQFRW